MNRRSADRSALACRARSIATVAFGLALLLALITDDASAATLRNSAAPLGALAMFAALVFIREWPIALTGSIWAAGTLFAAALWLLRTRYRPDWFRGGESGRCHAVVSPVAPIGVAAIADSIADHEAVLEAARRCFVNLQAAWDANDVETMRLHTTTEMLEELMHELPICTSGPNRTEIVTLDAALLCLDEIGSRYVASVEFSGMIRESIERGAAPFKEVWMLTCHKDETPGWRLARQQALL